MPIRHLWLLITSQPLGLRCSGGHTWLRPDYILPPAGLIWLFMGQAVLSTDWQNMSQLIEKHGLAQRTSNGSKHDPEASRHCWPKTFDITMALDVAWEIRWLVAFLQPRHFELLAIVFMQLGLIQSVPVSGAGIQAILKILKRESS